MPAGGERWRSVGSGVVARPGHTVVLTIEGAVGFRPDVARYARERRSEVHLRERVGRVQLQFMSVHLGPLLAAPMVR